MGYASTVTEKLPDTDPRKAEVLRRRIEWCQILMETHGERTGIAV